mgnify:FL=1
MISVRPDEWRRVRDVFDRALALPAGQRQWVVTEACLGDEDLHRHVSALLEAHERADDFLETACVVPALESPEEDLSGAQFGPYRLDSRIGGGGMGGGYHVQGRRLSRPLGV